jgi:hypothetical protein
LKQFQNTGNGNLDLNSQEIKKCIHKLKEIDFELTYLAMLTRQGLKPLSRWEKPLDDNSFGLLKLLGLLTKQINRTVKTGKVVSETIFSVSSGYIRLYERRFVDRPIDKSALTIRFEGFLFGFPPCCVDEYIRQPYIKNTIDPKDQKNLFHWACKDCKITPTLLPEYRRIHEYLTKC